MESGLDHHVAYESDNLKPERRDTGMGAAGLHRVAGMSVWADRPAVRPLPPCAHVPPKVRISSCLNRRAVPHPAA